MIFKEAAAFAMPFGKHKGRTLDDIARTDEGLLYLDWLRGEQDAQVQGGPLINALTAYLDNPTIAADVAKLAKWKS